jgi:PAS domain S-box-containing protein
MRDTKQGSPRGATPKAEPLDERHLRLLVDAVTDYAIFMLDPKGRISSWNSGAERINGYKAEEVLGKNFDIFFIEEDRAKKKSAMALDIAREAGRFEDEGWRLRKDGSRFWALSVLDTIHDETGQIIGFAKITRDITDRRKAQQALEEAREQFFQAQKLEAIGQLTGGVAHDFNNLLAAILSGLSLAERLAGGNEKLVQLLGTIRQAGQRGQGLTQQLLTFARRQATRPEIVQLSRRMSDTFILLERLLGGHIRVTMNIPGSIWPIEVDAGQLDLALLNMCLNARDAMPNGGTLSIVARNETRKGPATGEVARYVVLTVSDTGCGIPENIKGRIFEPFFTTKDVGKGTGLGLSQAYGFVKQANGSISVDNNQAGQGTTVTIQLPAAKTAETEAWEDYISPDAAPKGGGIILLVEDDIAVAELTAALFEHAGYAVKVVHSAAAALEVLKRGNQVDALFSDVVMPGGMNGFQLARTVQSEYPGVPVLLTTGFSGAAEVAQIRGIRIIPKPYDPEEVTSSLAKLIAEARRNASGTVH